MHSASPAKLTIVKFLLSDTPSVGNHFLAELRDAQIQQDSMRFRKNMERLGEVFAYEISKTFNYKESEVSTALGTAVIPMFEDQPVLVTILKAGLPIHRGLLNFFDKSDSAFISVYRKTKKSGEIIVQKEYMATPVLDNRVVIVTDAMLATGMSMVLCCRELMTNYKIKQLHIVSMIASSEGLAHVKANLPKAKLWIGAIDEEMTSKAFIVPGIGDVSDLAFGIKS
jgi:uracil phosphoribosyltransferase